MEENNKELQLIKSFLKDFKQAVEERTGEPFNPRHLAIISQPKMTDITKLDWVAYHRWFDEVQYGVSEAQSNNLIQAFLEMPIHILIEAEEIGKPLLSLSDQKKLTQAFKLISEINLKS